MPVRPIVRLGHPALRTPAAPVAPDHLSDLELELLIDDLFETMLAAGGVGLAAPQIGVGLQIFTYAVIDPDAPPAGAGEEDGEHAPELRVLINPAIDPRPGELVYDWEGCLSIPDLRGLVPRHPAVRVHALDRGGGPLDYHAEGYEARIVPHEYDHLNGVVFLDRMRDLLSLAFGAEWQQFLADHEEAQVG